MVPPGAGPRQGDRARVALFVNDVVGLRALELTLAHPAADVRFVGYAGDRDPATAAEIARVAAPAVRAVPLARRIPPAVLETLREQRPDLVVLAWWPFILDPETLAVARRGVLNFHPGHLPHGRGMNSNFWAVVEGRPYGVTLHFADPTVDGGDIAYQRSIPVSWEDTGTSLLARARQALVELYAEHLDEILAGAIPRRPQPPGGTLHRRAELDPASRLDLDAPTTGRQVLDLLRARMFTPSAFDGAAAPAAHFTDGGRTYQVTVSIRPV